MRKDVTFFEVLEGVDGLHGTSALVLDALERLQPLADAVVAHTDGRSTHHAPNEWFQRLTRADVVAALVLLARSATVDGGRFGWRLEEAAHEALRASVSDAAPQIVALALAMLRFDVEDARDAAEAVEWRLIGLGRLADLDMQAAHELVRRLAAQVQGDHREAHSRAEDAIIGFARSRGFALGALRMVEDDAVRPGPTAAPDQPSNDAWVGGAGPLTPYGRVFPEAPVARSTTFTPLVLMTELYRELERGIGSDQSIDRLVNRIGYACLMWLGDGRQEDVTRLIRFFARELPRSISTAPLAQLGEGFQRFGHSRLAALAFTLAFARSRGGGGWDSLGGDEHVQWLDRALSLDDAEAKATLATEIVHTLENDRYALGITPGIVRRTAGWGEHTTAAAAWNEAYLVVRNRLLSNSRHASTFLPFQRADTPPWSIDEALIALALGRTTHPELVRRRLALLAFAEMLRCQPDAAARPLSAFFSRDVPGTAFRSVLQVLDTLEVLPEATLRAIESNLRLVAFSDSYGDRLLARRLLARIGIEARGASPAPPSPERRPSATREAEVLSLDVGGRVRRLAHVWPLLPRAVAARFDELWEKRMSVARERARYSVFAERERAPWFWTPFITWERELFETALHEAANGLTAALWASGDWSSEHEEDVLRLLLPDVKLMIAIEASRSPRPPLPRPNDAPVGLKSPGLLAADDEFPGWVRIAYTEQEYVLGEHRHWRDPTEVAWVVEGTQVAGLPPISSQYAPVVDADANTWFDIGEVPPTVISVGRAGPLCGAVHLNDLLGTTALLVPAPELAALYGLRPAPWPGRLAWIDEMGAPAVVLRVWRVGNIGMNLAGERPVLEGCEVVARPDLVHRLTRAAGLSLYAISNTHRNKIGSREPRDR